MGIKKLVVTSLLAIMATGISVGTAHAAPAKLTPDVLHGTDRGVTYTSTLSKDRQGITTTLKSGKFSMSPDRAAVAVTAPNGAVTARLPIAFQAVGRQVQLTPEISRDGTSLTLRPAAKTAALSDIRAFNKEVAQPQLKDVGFVGIVGGVFVGAAIGAVIGALIGLLFFGVGAIPGLFIGLVVGAFIGAFVGGAFIWF